jgi:hypothetical protein
MRVQSKRRRLVAQKRQAHYKDILGRKTREKHWRFLTKKRFRRASLAEGMNMINHALTIDKISLRYKLLVEYEV